MLDTVTCIQAMRADVTSQLFGRFNRMTQNLCISSVVLAELHYGAENSQNVVRNLQKIDKLVDRLQAVLDFDALAAANYGRVRTALRKHPIGPLDMMIAAHARSRDLIVVTSNTREFKRVPGLGVEDWSQPAA